MARKFVGGIVSFCLFYLSDGKRQDGWMRSEFDRIPESIKLNKFPDHMVNLDENRIDFEIPERIRGNLIADQSDFLNGACLKAYEAYSDGVRMDNVKNVLGNQAYDAMIESILYDYAHGDCNWVDEYFGQLIGEFRYVPYSKAGIFRGISQYGSVSSELANYFAYWLESEMNPSDFKTLYSDNSIAWKQAVADAFLRLKKPHNLAQNGKGTPRELKCERVNPVNFFREPENVEDTPHDNIPEDPAIQALVDPEKRADVISRWIINRENNDIEGPSPDKPNGPDPTGYTVVVSFLAEVCLGISIKVGAGISINVITGEQSVIWTYGFGDIDESRPVQDMRIQVSHFCESTMEFGTVWSVGYVMNDRLAYNHLYSPYFKEFLGISFENGYLHDFEMNQNDMNDGLHFGWYRNTRIAMRIPERQKNERNPLLDDDYRRLNSGHSEGSSTRIHLWGIFAFFVILTALVFTFGGNILAKQANNDSTELTPLMSV